MLFAWLRTRVWCSLWVFGRVVGFWWMVNASREGDHMRFRKRPLVVDAVRCVDVLRAAGEDWSGLPGWLADAYKKGDVLVWPDIVEIRTLEGWMTAGRDDWIVRGVEGEIYPCKASVFEVTYEPVEDGSPFPA